MRPHWVRTRIARWPTPGFEGTDRLLDVHRQQAHVLDLGRVVQVRHASLEHAPAPVPVLRGDAVFQVLAGQLQGCGVVHDGLGLVSKPLHEAGHTVAGLGPSGPFGLLFVADGLDGFHGAQHLLCPFLSGAASYFVSVGHAEMSPYVGDVAVAGVGPGLATSKLVPNITQKGNIRKLYSTSLNLRIP